jgi:hypothetical protein
MRDVSLNGFALCEIKGKSLLHRASFFAQDKYPIDTESLLLEELYENQKYDEPEMLKRYRGIPNRLTYPDCCLPTGQP